MAVVGKALVLSLSTLHVANVVSSQHAIPGAGLTSLSSRDVADLSQHDSRWNFNASVKFSDKHQRAPPFRALNRNADTVVLYPVGDSLIRDGNFKDRNFGQKQFLNVRVGLGESVDRKAVLKFNLGAIDVSEVKTAKLRLYVNTVKRANPRTIFISRLRVNDWDENTVTWANLDTAIEQVGPTFVVQQTDAYSWVEVDVSNLIGGDVISFILHYQGSRNRSSAVHFGSRESSFPPELVILRSITSIASSSGDHSSVRGGDDADGLQSNISRETGSSKGSSDRSGSDKGSSDSSGSDKSSSYKSDYLANSSDSDVSSARNGNDDNGEATQVTSSPSVSASVSPSTSPSINPSKEPSFSPSNSPVGRPKVEPEEGINTCKDEPEGWFDSFGPWFDCVWYDQNNCPNEGDEYRNFEANAQEACCACGGGKRLHKEPCDSPTYTLMNVDKTWDEHDKTAKRERCDLASIHSFQELSSILVVAGKRNVLIGGKRTKGTWEWSDGSSWDYTNWQSADPHKIDGNEGHVELLPDGRWIASSGSTTAPAVYKCCKPGGEVRTVGTIEASCLQPSYVLMNVAKTWAEHEHTANRQGCHLSSVRGSDELDAVKAVAGELDVWIGGMKKGGSSGGCGGAGCWEWSDGSSWNYYNWQSGEPNNYRGQEDRVKMLPNGEWNDSTGSEKASAVYKCCKQVEPVVPTTETTCKQPSYVLMNVAKTWAEHEHTANRQGCHLSSIKSSDELNVVLATAGNLQVWIGGMRSPASVGATCGSSGCWGWSDGSSWSFENWELGEPNSRADPQNARLQLLPGGGQWIETSGVNEAAAVYKCCK